MVKLRIITHSGTEDIVDIDTYDALETVKDLNNSSNEHVIAFGDNIYSKIDIKSVKPVVEAEAEE